MLSANKNLWTNLSRTFFEPLVLAAFNGIVEITEIKSGLDSKHLF